MRILHTADWHLGARLVERDRLSEHAAFLDWLIETLRDESIDALLLSGDVFDAANPPQDAVALYFDFLKRLADLRTVKAVITGGNHDSASHLNAPRELLKRFEVHVFGHAGENVVDLGDVIVAAVPFLRERDLRQAAVGESMTDVQSQVRAAICTHYATQHGSCRVLAGNRPVIAMGHLTVLGATTCDSERDIHIGNLGAVGADVFAGFDYTALGHLHRPQQVGGQAHVRYSGSPVALSFSEAADGKSVVVIDTQGQPSKIYPAEKGTSQQPGSKTPPSGLPSLCGIKIEMLAVPVKRLLTRVKVSRATLAADLQQVPAASWAEVTVKLDAPEADLDRQVREAAAGRFEVLKILADLPASAAQTWQHTGPALNELQPREVFRELLKERQIGDEGLNEVFDELLAIREQKVTA